ncbi:MAG: diaminopimelate epimerase [Candidatus Hydrothermarchaeales archaeon]
MRFYKYHGAGNDFILINSLLDQVPQDKKAELARRLCHRRFGVGGDGLIFLESSTTADIQMRIFNPDGSEAEMCGNGIRCLAKYAYDKSIVAKERMVIETLAGPLEVTVDNGKEVGADLGRPEFDRAKIPASGNGTFLNEEVEGILVSAVNLGVPHVVAFAEDEDIDNIDVSGIGRRIRGSELFPKGTNVNFLQAAGENRFKIRTYERGVEAETLACGTGIGASAAVAVALGKAKSDSPIAIDAKGGKLFVEVVEKDGVIEKVLLRGPVEFVFEGEM